METFFAPLFVPACKEARIGEATTLLPQNMLGDDVEDGEGDSVEDD